LAIEDAQGVAQIVRTNEIEQPIDDGPVKPPHIHRAIGRRPIMAAGNSDGDIHVLKYGDGHAGISLRLLVHHDDAEREYAYDSGSEQSRIICANPHKSAAEIDSERSFSLASTF
jgi:hypothetical protein